MKTQFLVICLVLCVFLCGQVESARHHKRLSFRHAALAVKEPVWGLDAAGNVYAVNQYNNLVKIPGKTLIYLDVKVVYGQLYVWGIDKYHDVYYRIGEKSSWTYFPGKKLKFLRIQGPSRIWGLNDNGQIFTVNTTTKQWKQIPGTLKYLDVQSNGRIWGINPYDLIFTRGSDGGDLVAVPGQVAKLRVIDSGRVWALNAQDSIFAREGVYDPWVQIAGKLRNFDVNNRNDFWGTNVNNDIFYRNIVGGPWTQVFGGKFGRLRVTESGRVYALSTQNELWTNDVARSGWVRVGGAQLVALNGPDNRF